MYADLHNGADMDWICEISSSSHLALERDIYGWRCWEGRRKVDGRNRMSIARPFAYVFSL